MIIEGIQFNCELIDILLQLKTELIANKIDLIRKYKEGPTHIQICCPYHNNGQERRPSAGIRKEDGIFHCFTCGEVHSLPEVISYCFGYTDDIIGKFGMQWLLKNFATVQKEERKDVALDFYRDSKHISNDNSVCYITEEELDKYRYIHPYMYKRGLTDDVIEIFDIGYDSSTQTITFPIKDISGNCLFVARRSVKGKFFNYPEGVEKPVYGLYELYHIKSDNLNQFPTEVIVCESMLDALSFWTINKYAVALNGLGTERQIRQLLNLPCRKIILATDMDEAGLKARKKLKEQLKNKKIVTEYIFPKGRKDANECTKEELMNLEEVL